MFLTSSQLCDSDSAVLFCYRLLRGRSLAALTEPSKLEGASSTYLGTQGECGEGGTGPQPGHHPERGGAREQRRRKDHPIVGSQ
ncbi:hypothetical protein EPR50_G00220170 [Perca flavescens]|uniref:Uncharacterized protein n=1 Tax=Perca flavescens TaxID=8167 RepID=A0A484C7P8_PERFV|nr:hypothetical protein EPR50_G00220170 [Perca flavescens]